MECTQRAHLLADLLPYAMLVRLRELPGLAVAGLAGLLDYVCTIIVGTVAHIKAFAAMFCFDLHIAISLFDEFPLLVVAAMCSPLVDIRTVSRRRLAYVNPFATVDCSDREVVVISYRNIPFLVQAAMAEPLLDIPAVA